MKTKNENYVDGMTDVVLRKMEKLVEKYGYLPICFNVYNLCEIGGGGKSPTMSTACGSWDTSASCILFERVKEK